MDKPQRILFRPRTLVDLLLPALTLTFGLQLLRVFFPGLVWYLQDTAGAGSITLAFYAFGAFLVGFLAAGVLGQLGEDAAGEDALRGVGEVKVGAGAQAGTLEDGCDETESGLRR